MKLAYFSVLFSIVAMLVLSFATLSVQTAAANEVAQQQVALAAVQARAPQRTQYLTRQQIRSLPITQRPNRPGHFIGNTIRRRAAR